MPDIFDRVLPLNLGDLLAAITMAAIYNAPVAKGPTYWIPGFWVPLLLVTHYVTLFFSDTHGGS